MQNANTTTAHPPMTAQDALDKVSAILKERGALHGNGASENSFVTIGAEWGTSAEDAAWRMLQMKYARIKSKRALGLPPHLDDFLDLIGYTAKCIELGSFPKHD